jgi:hypothetical protein
MRGIQDRAQGHEDHELGSKSHEGFVHPFCEMGIGHFKLVEFYRPSCRQMAFQRIYSPNTIGLQAGCK